jgi:molecular chaperone GrpE
VRMPVDTKEKKINSEVENEALETETVEVNVNEASSLSSDEIDYRTQFLRVTADYQNFKRRIEKERSEWMTAAQASVLKKILPIIDDFDRAIKSDQEGSITKEEQVWLEGFEMIRKKFMKTMADLGVEEISCEVPFDPEVHEALLSIESEDHKEGEIAQVLSKGYRFKDEVLVHAKVSVAK